MFSLLTKHFPISRIQRTSYREDINSLRAYAVLGVVIYHAKFGFFESGYLGVDVFFVISGYLISNIIISELNEKKFSFRNFYLRRIKRILPALFTMLTLSIGPAYYLLYPKAFTEFTNSLLSTLFFYSNYYFKLLDFYNAEPAQYMPLLHTWSLSVEEQFYIIFPFLIFIIYRYISIKSLLLIIGLVTIASLYLNTLTADISKFYNLEFRAWQLLAGVLAMIFSSSTRIKNSQYLGLFLILFSFNYFDDDWILNIEPRILATSGAVLVLISENKDKDNIFISNKILNIIGLSSFSLYLIHQPTFAFIRYYKKVINWQNLQEDLFLIEKIVVLLVLIVLSYFSFLYIEKPFIENFNYFKIGILVFCSLIIILASLNSQKLTELRYDTIDSSYKITSYLEIERNMAKLNGQLCHDVSITNTCKFNDNENKRLILLGDSHSITLGQYLSENVVNQELQILTGDACLYIKSKQPVGVCDNKDKKQFDEYINSISDSIFIYVGNIYSQDYSVQYDLQRDIYDTLKEITVKGNKVIVVQQIPKFPYNVVNQYYTGVKWGEVISFDYQIWKNDERKIYIDNIYNQLNELENIYTISTENIFCNSFVSGQCVGAYEEYLFYYDDNHITIDGAALIGEQIIETITKISKDT
jgi:peptidoglycan/LPS O-acetylase OafA/YrhL